MTSLVRVILGTYSSADNFHESQITSSLANARFVFYAWMARNLYSSWCSKIILVRVLSFLSVSFPHIQIRQFRQNAFSSVKLIDSLSSAIPSLFHEDSIYLFRRPGFENRRDNH